MTLLRGVTGCASRMVLAGETK